MKLQINILLLALLTITGCGQKKNNIESEEIKPEISTVRHIAPLVHEITVPEISLTKKLEYDKYTLEDVYKYQNKTRSFKWERIKQWLAFIENRQNRNIKWVVIQNYRNANKEAPAVRNFIRNEYDRVCDTLYVEKYQSAPLYLPDDTIQPLIYARDGSVAEYLGNSGTFCEIRLIDRKEHWFIPERYVRFLKSNTRFSHVIVVDRGDQNIATLKNTGRAQWDILSMNPATTGLHKPPHAQETPLGIFLLQEKKKKMFFWKDGTKELGGFAPFATRFTQGAYLHGIPVNLPAKDIIEYSWSLGTTPRSHMCVRNATSHAEFIYKNMPLQETLVLVIE